MWVKYKVPIIVSSIGIFLIIFGAILRIYWVTIFNKVLLSKLALSDTSMSFEMWKKTPIPMYSKIHLFNWTNHEEFLTHNVTPNFVEMGPYVFREVDFKIPIKWNDNDTLTFRQKRVWHFEPSMSNGSLDDVVTNLNPVVATVGSSFLHEPHFFKMVLNRIMVGFNEHFVIRKTVRELLFNGYDDKLLKLALKMNATKLPYTKFGWFYKRNGSETYDGTFTMLRGQHNISDMGTLLKWNYSNKTNVYSGKCNNIKGKVGDLWPPLSDNRSISIFVPDICTDLTLKYDNTTEHLGLNGLRFISDKTMLDNGEKDPNRKCYCANNQCQPTGTLNVAKCKFDAPAYVSLPHFYLADESYRKKVSGMNPSKEKHEFEMSVEPKTGIPLKVRAQLQINLLIKPDKDFSMFQNVTETYVPMLWFTQEAALTPEIASKIKFVVIMPMLGHATFFGICGIGFLLVFIAVAIHLRIRQTEDDRQNLLKD